MNNCIEGGVRMSIRLTPKQYEHLRLTSERVGVTMVYVIRDVIEAFIRGELYAEWPTDVNTTSKDAHETPQPRIDWFKRWLPRMGLGQVE